MSERAVSMSIDEIGARAEKAANAVFGSRLKEIGGKGVDVGFFPDIGTMGLICHGPKLENFTATELLDMSHAMIKEMDISGDVRANVSIRPGGITMGYFPHDPVMIKQLF